MSVRLKVENYQSVKEVDLTIQGLTLLKGVSNAGKSSIFKAMQAACNNRFRVGCVTFGEEQTVIRIKYSDDPRVFTCVRLASGASPKIRLGNKNDGYLTFDKLNRTVPLELQKFHNFGKIKTATDEDLDVNFVSQFTPPLLFNFSPRKIVDIIASSEEMTKLFRAKKILDQNNADLKGAHKTLTDLLSETKDKIHKVRVEVAKLPPKNILLEYEKAITELMTRADLLNKLTDLTLKVKEKRERLDVLYKLTPAINSANEFSSRTQYLSSLKSKTEQLLNISDSLRIINLIIESASLNTSVLSLKSKTDILLSLSDKRRILSLLVDLLNSHNTLSWNKTSISALLDKLSKSSETNNRLKVMKSVIPVIDEAIKASSRKAELDKLLTKIPLLDRHKDRIKLLSELTSELGKAQNYSSALSNINLILNKMPVLETYKVSLKASKESEAENKCPFCGEVYNHNH